MSDVFETLGDFVADSDKLMDGRMKVMVIEDRDLQVPQKKVVELSELINAILRKQLETNNLVEVESL